MSDKMITMNGYDDCIIGVCHSYDNEPVFAYDLGKVIDKLMEDGMDRIEALEWWSYNRVGAFVDGGPMPVFIDLGNETLGIEGGGV